MKETKEYHVDENNNKWDKDVFTLEEAMEYSKTLVNCYYCIDCCNSKTLVNCTSCSDCSNSKTLVNCHDCHDCHDCNDLWCCANYYNNKPKE